MSKGKGGGGSRAANNARSNSMNPNNAAYHASSNNRSNQMNPNNPAYSSSRSGGGSGSSVGGGSGGWGGSGEEEWVRLAEGGALPELLNGANVELRFDCECGCGGEMQSARYERGRVAPIGGIERRQVLEELVCEESNFRYKVESYQASEGPALRVFEQDHPERPLAIDYRVSYGRDV